MVLPIASPLDFEAIPTAVTEILADYIDGRWAEIERIGAPVVAAVSELRTFVLGGGKRIRPLYGWAGFVGAGGVDRGENLHAVLTAVSSLELIQACALVHDDIIDASDTRRNAPTVHRGVEKRHAQRGWRGDSAHFGTSVATLVGDLALAWADDMVLDLRLSQQARLRLLEPWRAMRTEVIGGQLLDIALEATGSEDIALANNVNRYKTAAYTIERPLHLGAAIAGADATTISAFRGYGRDIGVAFQLRDDLLGVFGDPEVTGKPAGDDLREGKRTVLLALALKDLDHRDPHAAARLRAGIGATQGPAHIAELTSIIAESSAPQHVEQRIATLVESGLEHLTNGAHISAETTELLRALAIRSTSRKK